jgi:MSHA biogenesis protein MshO
MRRPGGFTLVELIVVITLIGVVATLIAVPLIQPVKGFSDVVRRAAMSDALDNALRRVAREARNVLPNSVRQPASACVEMLPTVGGGRYRVNSAAGDPLDFAMADTTFDVLSSTGLEAIPAGSRVVVYNLGITGSDVYSLENAALIQSFTSGKVTLSAGKQFPFESPGSRFHVIPDKSVVYACITPGTSGDDGTGRLVRYTRSLGTTGLAALGACPTAAPSDAVTLVDQVSACAFQYTTGVLQRDGILVMNLAIRQGGEEARLFHETHVNNVP